MAPDLRALLSANGIVISNLVIIPLASPVFNIPEGEYAIGEYSKSGYRHLVVVPGNGIGLEGFIGNLVSNLVRTKIRTVEGGWISIPVPQSALEYLSLREGSRVEVRDFGYYFEIWGKPSLERYSRYLKLPFPKRLKLDLERYGINV